jgi:hypothetical protein
MSEMRGVTEVNGTQEFRYFVDGEWRTTENNKLFDVYRPYGRSVYARVAAGGRPEATPVTDDQLRELYELLKFGPTSANCCAARFV